MSRYGTHYTADQRTLSEVLMRQGKEIEELKKKLAMAAEERDAALAKLQLQAKEIQALRQELKDRWSELRELDIQLQAKRKELEFWRNARSAVG